MIMIIPAGDEWGQRKSSFRGEDSERKSRVLWLVGTSEMHYLDISLFVVAFGHPSINSFIPKTTLAEVSIGFSRRRIVCEQRGCV